MLKNIFREKIFPAKGTITIVKIFLYFAIEENWDSKPLIIIIPTNYFKLEANLWKQSIKTKKNILRN